MTTEDPLQTQLAKLGASLWLPAAADPKLIGENGPFPNNDHVPLLLYRHAVELPATDPAAAFELIFRWHGWRGIWRNGVYVFHHYHSTAHEVLGVYSGEARLQLGGDDGLVVDFIAGDVVLIPAGVAHKNLGSSADFGVVGAYPPAQSWDMNYGKPDERPRVDGNVARVPVPDTDPVYGPTGPLLDLWA